MYLFDVSNGAPKHEARMAPFGAFAATYAFSCVQGSFDQRVFLMAAGGYIPMVIVWRVLIFY